MEKMNFVKNGIIRLPPGFRFHPTDEELVVQYLRRKVFLCPLPASIIPEIDVSKFDPWDLPGDWEQERYYFSTREAKYRNGNRTNRATGSGYWKATGLDKQILVSKGNVIVGMKKTLVFYRGKPPSGTRTDWIMHEYRLAGAGTKLASNQSSKVHMEEDWVLCRIFLKKRNSKNGEDVITNGLVTKPVDFTDFMNQDRTVVVRPASSTSSSSASSGVTTDVTSTASDSDENNSCNSMSSFPCRKKP
ncbi:hypothetical protein C5167_006943 [Papaver somniferum]|uniref:NAC domain-containing protein n=1 Tax=Papaver somniferum TaxID=3469 RepID=A0A4Y7JIK7_PAPSO|nr:NAC domain-containing protein 83-like [Papaver somniferum]RZC59638.1 hypothetical protein C5167_006943 [Papaver somniferum]